MKKIEHPLFSFEVPDSFDQEILSEIIALSRSSIIPHKVQPHFIRLNLEEINDLDNDEIKGITLSEKMLNYYLAKESQNNVTEVSETIVNGHKTLSMSAKVNTTILEKGYSLHYLFAAIFVDDTHFISFIAIHEITKDGLLEKWTTDALHSIVTNGNINTRKQAAIAYTERFDKLVDVGEEEEQVKEYSLPTIPKDGKEIFTVGNLNFEFITDESKMHIPAFSKELVTTIKAKTTKIKKGIKEQILDDYPGDGLVNITISAKGIHVNGKPNGTLYFEDGKTNAPLFLTSRIEGFDYRLDFNGNAHFEEGWFLLNGEMTKSYHDKSFPIQVSKKFDTKTLEWENYKFSSLEETKTANANEVQFLSIINPEFTQLPKTIFKFKNLEDISISQHSKNWKSEKLPLLEIQSEIGNLTKLKKLYINGTLIEKLPKSIEKLQDLERLSINNCLLKTIPESVFKLPKLTYLSLSSNQLTIIPKEMDVPKLHTLYLENNKLKTVPEVLANQPKLKKINLKRNPLEYLPEIFNTVESIDLSIEDKTRLLDFSYKGANDEGTIEWNDTIFWSKNDSDLALEIDRVIIENKLEEHATALRSLVKKCIGFTHDGEDDYTQIGNHRFGGMPDLPEDIAYPRFGENENDGIDDYAYEFIGQINCSQISHLQKYLPRNGTLFFFLETIHNVYGASNDPCKVIYCENNEKLVSGKRFKFYEDDYYEMFDASAYKPYKVKAYKMNSAPSLFESHINTHLLLGEAEKLKNEEELLDRLYDTFEIPINDNNVFQYAINPYGFAQNEHAELQASNIIKRKLCWRYAMGRCW